MKKVAIITIQSINLGNRLQNYALQEAIKELGYDVYTLQRVHKTFSVKTLVEDIKDLGRTLLGTRKGRYIRFDRARIRFGKEYVLANEADSDLADKYFCGGERPSMESILRASGRNKRFAFFCKERSKNILCCQLWGGCCTG